MNWRKWKTKLQSLDVSSAIGTIKENTSSAVSFVKNISSSEPQQYIEAEQLGIYYITPNVIAMGYPSTESLFSSTSNATLSKLGKFVSDSLANKMSAYLNKYHCGRYMIWNLSEKSYPTQIFNDSVIEFKFPGYPSPPLQQLFELLSSIDNWLCSNDENVAIIHCQTGKGRTVTVISAYLSWSKYKKFTPAKALLHCVKMMNGTIKNMTIPSQTRYLAYLTKILMNRQTPKQNALMIQRVILHKIPVFEMSQHTYFVKKKKDIDQSKSPSLLTQEKQPQLQEAQFTIGSIDDDDEEEENKEEIEEELGQNIKINEEKDQVKDEVIKDDEVKEEEKERKVVHRSGVRAYIQIFKNAKLIFSSRRKNTTLKFYDVNEGHIKFEVNQSICGDVLVRIRHLCSNGRDKISVCRFAFHTGYLDSNRVIRFKKTQLDGAWNSSKFNKEFWIDLLIGDAMKSTQNNEENELFWSNILSQCSNLSVIDTAHRYCITDNAYSDNEWKETLIQWNLTQYITHFEEKGLLSVDEWKELSADDLINIGLSRVDAQIFLNLNDNPHNVANQEENDLDRIQSKIDIKDENDQNLLNEMDNSAKEVIEAMHTHLIIDDDKDKQVEEEEEEEEEEEVEREEHHETKNAEEHADSLDNTFNDLEQFADGLDLENVQVDSDTEQNFEMLLEELNDDSIHQNKDSLDLP